MITQEDFLKSNSELANALPSLPAQKHINALANTVKIESSNNLNGQPLVSVIIPAYNAERFICQTLDSVLAQAYSNLEVFVVDDGSQDDTASIVREYMQRDSRIQLLEQKNFGVAAARNLGIEKSTGEFIAPIDADDIWHPQHVSKQVKCFSQAPSSVGLVYSWSADINEHNRPTGAARISSIQGDVLRTLVCHNFIGNASCTLIRRSCFESVGGYSTALKAQQAQGCEDWDLYLRISERYGFCVVPELTVGYRKVSSSMSSDFRQMAKSHQLMLQLVQSKHPDIPHFLYRLSCSSFYMYLARQSNRYGNYLASLSWLYEAIKIDSITPIGRFGFYSLGIQNRVHPSYAMSNNT
ncbi:glycosyltransferase family 2 protein [Nodosilinea sp. LEGE 07298]|uniref:glycosyltransferase family 2 protein n=1 Tax=Nodosilinea sp. LEGE 07298 TaxID=2777970 RepID=UPI001882555F|nr:glycosyltransferase family A protein [Nodosilinea sp. LEGE 07298]MBE9109975.1 glycosyltransferase family 2 protein [Nodosilinea sp. LEGE 07298]